ncbi:DUF1269 domain-containing protein [Chitinivorax sp. B]|uniref:DUF1269 domain-containing protein n=1 Tax=Chitinivorax sp. B TaxID=2502235 RepID=UPI0010F6753A|nr:DUF1269 domain-containing protein [Chitinivorax sp. B]
MSKRLYFLLPDVQVAKQTMNDLLLARIDQRHIHFLAKMDLGDAGLHQANLLQESDVVHGAQTGLLMGAATGLLLGIGAAFFLASETGPIWGVTLAMFLFGALFGAWAAGMIGISATNSRHRQFESELEKGSILLMVDVPKARVEEIRQLVEREDPHVKDEGQEPTIPAFP